MLPEYMYTLGLFVSTSLCVSLILTFYLFYMLIVFYKRMFGYSRKVSSTRELVALFIIAHPDDECMFFGPSIVNLARSGYCIYILCLSTGNYEKLGYKRKDELRESCKILGISLGNVITVQHSGLPDNPSISWNKVLVGGLLLKYIRSLTADLVLSFDSCGISGHANHISIHNALRHLVKKGQIARECKIYILETVNILRKYSSFMDVPSSYLAGGLTYISTYEDVGVIQKAMRAHKTQFVWFRKLYMCFSRYVYINTYKELKV